MRGEWKSAAGGKRERTRYSRYAKATFRKDRQLNIRLSSKDLEAIHASDFAVTTCRNTNGSMRSRSTRPTGPAAFELLLRAP